MELESTKIIGVRRQYSGEDQIKSEAWLRPTTRLMLQYRLTTKGVSKKFSRRGGRNEKKIKN